MVRAAVLLEVLVTVVLIAIFMAVIGSQILSAVEAADKVDRRQTAMLLAESLASRLQAGGFDLSEEEDQITGDFGELYPAWAWKITAEPLQDDETLMRVNLQIFYDESEEAGQVIESLTPILSLYTYWAVVPEVDLVQDFGLSEQEVAALAEVVSADGLDLGSLDPGWLTNIDSDRLRELTAALTEAARSGSLASVLGSGGPLSGLSGLLGPARGGGRRDAGIDTSGGRFDVNELIRMLEAGRKQDAIDYVQQHLGDEGSRSSTERSGVRRRRPARESDEPDSRRDRRSRLHRSKRFSGGDEKADNADRPRHPQRGRASRSRR